MGASWAQLGPSWPPLELNLAALGLNLEALGPSKPHSKRYLAPLGPHLSAPSRTPSATWPLLGAILPFRSLQAQLGLHLALKSGFQVPLGLNLALRTGLQTPLRVQVSSKWTSSGLRVPSKCSPSGLQLNFNSHTHLTLELSLALPFELPQQLPVRTKLHLNFHNSCRFQQYIVASALHCRWTSTGAR